MAVTELDHSSSVPLYRQITEILRDEILNGNASDFERTTEAKLIKRFGVSLAPIRQALKELTNEGLVFRKQGKGTFPFRGFPVDRPANLKSGDLYRYLVNQGLNPTSRVAGLERIEPPAEVRARLGMGEGEQLLHFTRLIAVGDDPLAEIDIYIRGPEDFMPLEEELNDGGSAFTLLESRYGITLNHAEHEAWATGASPEYAAMLGVGLGSPIFVIGTVFYSKSGTATAWRLAVHRPDEFKFHFLSRA